MPYCNHHANEKRPYIIIISYHMKNLFLQILEGFILSIAKQSSVYVQVPRTYTSGLFLEIWYLLTPLIYPVSSIRSVRQVQCIDCYEMDCNNMAFAVGTQPRTSLVWLHHPNAWARGALYHYKGNVG